MLDLYNNKYDRTTLKANIYSVKLIDILKTQTIDVSFAAKYILNKKYQLHTDDNISIPIVLIYQPHINKNELIELIKYYDTDDDSVDDFETVSEKKF
jgi:hypothetical protein